MSSVRTKKIVVFGLSFSVAGVAALWTFLAYLTVRDFESLLLCSQGRDEWVPKAACQRYLFSFRGRPDEIAALNRGVGVGWILQAEPISDREKLLDFLLVKGVDINAIDGRSGVSALHAAVLENNVENVRLLLDRRANPNIKARDRGQTPLQLAAGLSSKPNQPDRQEIIKILEAQPAAVH